MLCNLKVIYCDQAFRRPCLVNMSIIDCDSVTGLSDCFEM